MSVLEGLGFLKTQPSSSFHSLNAPKKAAGLKDRREQLAVGNSLRMVDLKP